MKEVNIPLEITFLAVREELMQYFKDYCFDKLIARTNVSVRRTEGMYGHAYERRESENTRPSVLYIGDVPIASLKREPDSIIINRCIMNRSKELKAIMHKIDEFLNEFLRGVRKEYNDDAII